MLTVMNLLRLALPSAVPSFSLDQIEPLGWIYDPLLVLVPRKTTSTAAYAAVAATNS